MIVISSFSNQISSMRRQNAKTEYHISFEIQGFVGKNEWRNGDEDEETEIMGDKNEKKLPSNNTINPFAAVLHFSFPYN